MKDVFDRRERRSSVCVAALAALSGEKGYSRSEHDAAMDRLLADLELDAARAGEDRLDPEVRTTCAGWGGWEAPRLVLHAG